MQTMRRIRVWKRLLQANVLLRRRIMIILSLIPAIALMVVCDNIFNDIYHYRTSYNASVEQLEKSKMDNIDTIIRNRKAEMELQNEYTIDYIRYNLTHNYNKTSIEDIERELHSSDKNTVLFTLYNDALESDNSNTRAFGVDKKERLFLADNNRIIISSKNVTGNLFIPWKDVMNQSKNRELEKNVISTLLAEDLNNGSDDILFITERMNNNHHDEKEPVTEPGIDSLNTIIADGGVEALKDYDILVPSYFDAGYVITKNNPSGNISHKLILIRSTNLYEIIKPYNQYISTYDKLIRDYKAKTESAIITKIVSCVIISIFLISLFSFCLHLISKSCRYESISDSRKGGTRNE